MKDSLCLLESSTRTVGCNPCVQQGPSESGEAPSSSEEPSRQFAENDATMMRSHVSILLPHATLTAFHSDELQEIELLSKLGCSRWHEFFNVFWFIFSMNKLGAKVIINLQATTTSSVDYA